MEQADCVIVGAGIGGAVLALALGRRGHRVVVLEREASAPAAGRPEVLAQSTVNALAQLGVGSRLYDEAVTPLSGLELRQAGGRLLFSIAPEDLQRAGVQPYSTDPNGTRRLLLEAARACGRIAIERGVDVQQVLRDGSRAAGVIATRHGQPWRLSARLVIGDDGSHSRIRAGLGIPLAMEEFALDFLVPTAALSAPSPAVGRAWIDPAALAHGLAACVIMPLPSGRSALALLLHRRVYDRLRQAGPGRFQEAAARLAPDCAALTARMAFPEAWILIRRPFGHAPRYVTDGAALLGDAAHPVTPVGGQGANMSVADALALSGVAHEALTRDDCSQQRLRAYEQLRWPANERSLQFSRRGQQVLRWLIAAPWLAPLAPGLVRRYDRPAVKQRLLRAVAGAFVAAA